MPPRSSWPTRVGSVIGSVLLGACAASPAVPPATVVVDMRDAPGFTVAAMPSAQATKMLIDRPAIEALENVGCRFRLKKWKRAGQGLNLYLGGGKPAWARLRADADVPVTVTIEDGWGAGVLDFEQAGRKIRSVVHADELQLRPRGAVVMDGFAVALPERRLMIENIAHERVRVSFYLGRDFASHAWIRTSLGCDEMSLGTASFKPAVAKLRTLDVSALRAGRRVQLRRRPQGKVVAELQPRDDLVVTVVARRNGEARIRWIRANVMLFGWVPQGALTGKVPGALGLLSGGGEGRAREKVLQGKASVVRCRSSLPLIVWQRGQARTVGTIGGEVRFEPSVMMGDLRAIMLRTPEIDMREGSFYTVASEIPKHCAAELDHPR